MTPPKPFDRSRRQLLTGAAAMTAAGLVSCGTSTAPTSATGTVTLPSLPNPANSGIDNIVVVVMENRTWDHLLGWVPGSESRQAGLSYPDKNGTMFSTFPLANEAGYGYQGCGKEDPDHGYDGGRVHLNGGAMDGWLKTVGDANVATDHFPIGYYEADDVPFFKAVAENFTLCDYYYHGILASTFPNRVYLHAGETDRTSNTLPPQQTSTLPTIWDRLAEKNVSRRYYFHDLPTVGLWGPKYVDISTRFEQFLADAASGTLPSVSYVDPRFVGEAPNGITNDDHPNADIRNGQAFLNSVYDALRNSPQWPTTLMVIVYDEWGGFFDHVAPPLAPVSEAEATFNDGRLGFRVPCALIGPRAKRNHVCHLQFDPNSLLNLICWRFGLAPLGVRALTSLNMAYALDLESPANTSAPTFNVPLGPFGQECSSGAPLPIPTLPGTVANNSEIQRDPSHDAHAAEWLALAAACTEYGCKV